VVKTDAAEMCFFLVIANSVGYNSFIVKIFNHLPSQNLILCPLHNWNQPRLRKDSLTLIKPLQKYESPCFICTCAMILSLTYFLLRKFCHAPSTFMSLKTIYLVNNDSRYLCFEYPAPDPLVGKLYSTLPTSIFLWSSLCQ
jgi:hypothetical protein